jgi:cytochrome c-type biogenesis protein CcmF
VSLFGRAILLVAFATAIFAVAAAIHGRTPRNRRWFRAAERAIFALFGLLTIGMVTLVVALLTDHFELEAVSRYSSRALESHFKLTALWASQPGSLMLWAWLLAGFSSIAILTNRNRNRELMPIVVATLGVLGVFFTMLLSFVASPFATVATVPADGQGLTPALRNPYMIAHPPLLYLGYVSIAIPFAFAIAALVTRRLDSAWLGSVRRWTLASWTFLGIGILLGAKWAYESLTFGGYWIWDPVENAALLPWLMATAFLHSVMVQERRGMLKVWNLALIVSTFALTLFGTFLTRSNIVSSVHNFGAQTVGPYLLAAIVVVLAVGIYLIVTRLPYLRSAHSLESYFSREAIFLYNNLLLVGLAFAVIWGTVFPVLSELVRGHKITVGRGFFDQVAAPIGVALLILTGVGPLIPWRKASFAVVRRRFVIPLIATAVAVPLVLLSDARSHWMTAAVFLIAVFSATCVVTEFVRGTKVRHALGGVSWFGAFTQMIARNRRRYGGYIVHIGIIVAIVGIAASRTFLSEGNFDLRPGQSASVAGYTFTAVDAQRARDANKMTVVSVLKVTHDGSSVATLRPAKNIYLSNGETGDEIAINTSPRRDIWVNLAGMTENRVATIHVFVNPMVSWIWAGGLIFLLGAIVAGWPTGRAARASAPAADRSERAQA